MAITASFAADFTDFSSEVDRAEKELDEFEATTMSAGQGLTKLSNTSAQAAPKVGNLQSSFSHFDSLLNSVGLHIGPAVKGLSEIGAAAGTTATALGAVGTAGLVVGTFMATFSATKAILEWTGLSTAIGNAVDAMYDFGKSEQEQGAKQDSIHLAIKRDADARINYADAVRYNDKWVRDHIKTAKEAAKADEEWLKATAELNTYGKSWQATLATINGTTVEGVKFYLDAGVSQGTLAKAYSLTEAQVKAVAEAMKVEQAELKTSLALQEELGKQVDAANQARGEAMGAIIDEIFGTKALQAATTWTDVMNTMGVSIQNLTSNQLTELNTAMLAGIDALARSGQLTSQQSSEFATLAAQAQAALAALQPVVTVTEDLVKAQWDYATATDAALAAMGKVKEEAQQTAAAAGLNKPPGVLLPPGGFALKPYEHVPTDLFGRPTTPGFASGLGTVNVNVYGSVLQTEQQLAQAVEGAMMNSYRKGGSRVPV